MHSCGDKGQETVAAKIKCYNVIMAPCGSAYHLHQQRLECCGGIVFSGFVALLHPHQEGQNNTGFLSGAHNAGAGADTTAETQRFLAHESHICTAGSAVFQCGVLFAFVQHGNADRIAKVTQRI